MDYEKMYKDALERAKKALKTCGSLDCEAARLILKLFPKLAESEEKTRKWLVDYFRSIRETVWIHQDITCEQILAWLEKQKERVPENEETGTRKEQKPVEFTHHEIDESLRDAVTHQMEDDGDVDDFVRRGIDDIALKYAELGAKWRKEQHPSSKFNPGDWVVYDGPLGHAILQVKDVVGGRYSFVDDNVSTLLVEDSDEFLRPLTPKDVEKPAECIPDSVKFEEGFKTGRELGFREGVASIKPAEWSEEDKKMLLSIINAFRNGTVSTIGQEQWLKSLPERFNLQPKEEWDDDDKAIVGCIACYLDGQFITEGARKQCQEWFNRHRRDFLNSSSWKPSEEQMEVLLCTQDMVRSSGYQQNAKVLASIYEQLKRLM